MKKILNITPFLLAFGQMAFAQCEAIALPYSANIEATTGNDLPECMISNYQTFASPEIFESIEGPIAGFEGRLLAYDTFIDTQWGANPNTWVSASLYTPQLQLTQGVNYVLSFRYGNSSPSASIDNVYLSLGMNGQGTVSLSTLENITGAVATNFVSEPFTVSTTGNYWIDFTVSTQGTQGLFYLDNITVLQEGTSGLNNPSLATVKAYPNPAGNTITLTGDTDISKVEFFSATGQQVMSKAINNNTAILNIESLSAGIYMMAVESGGNRETLKLIKI